MPITGFLQKAERLEIQAYKRPDDSVELRKTHVPFSGAPLKHPYDSQKVILVIDPYSTNTFYLEFNAGDISYVEDLPNLVNLDGETITMARIWVKKMSVGVRCTPFIVEETRTRER